MKINVWNIILQLSKERGVDPSVIVRAIEESVKAAAAKYYTRGEEIRVDFRPEKGELRVYAVKTVVESPADESREIAPARAALIRAGAAVGDRIEADLPSETLGRIAAQAAKQVIYQKFRDAEQEKIYDDFAPRLGEIVTGTLRRTESGTLVLELTGAEAVLPLRETLPQDDFRRGDQIKAVITQVLKGSRGPAPQILLSRTSPRFLAKLLELEIPEIASGVIEVKDVVRQPGERAKAAVVSKERDVDPVGACIGIKGARILAISKELGGEKIDIIAWSPNPAQYARAALAPARVASVVVQDKIGRTMDALVSQDQLSLAIGKKGINVKLASKLTGWRISVRPES